jgi:hypothetical protein
MEERKQEEKYSSFFFLLLFFCFCFNEQYSSTSSIAFSFLHLFFPSSEGKKENEMNKAMKKKKVWWS